MSERGNLLVSTISAVLSRARDLRSGKQYFIAYRAYRDALASTMTILFLRKMDMLEELDLSDARRLISLAGVIGHESLEVREELKKESPGMHGNKKARHAEDDDALYAVLCQVAGGPIEVEEA